MIDICLSRTFVVFGSWDVKRNANGNADKKDTLSIEFRDIFTLSTFPYYETPLAPPCESETFVGFLRIKFLELVQNPQHAQFSFR